MKILVDEGLTVILPLLVAGYLVSGVVNWGFFLTLDFSVVVRYREALLSGLALTVVVTLAAMLVGLGIAVGLALIARSGGWLIRRSVDFYTEIFRSAPVLITLFWVSFAVPALTGLSLPVVVGGVLAMTLQASAYLTDVIRAGIAAVPHGQTEGALSLGLSRMKLWRLIILPQAIRVMMPAIANILASMLKASAVLSAISIGELWNKAQQVGSFTFKPIEALSTAAILYFAIGKALMLGMRFGERRLRFPR